MLNIIIQHFLLDLGLNIFFDRIKQNFIYEKPIDVVSDLRLGDYVKVRFIDSSLSYGIYKYRDSSSIFIILYTPESDKEAEFIRIRMECIEYIEVVEDIDEDFKSNGYVVNPEYYD